MKPSNLSGWSDCELKAHGGLRKANRKAYDDARSGRRSHGRANLSQFSEARNFRTDAIPQERRREQAFCLDRKQLTEFLVTRGQQKVERRSRYRRWLRRGAGVRGYAKKR